MKPLRSFHPPPRAFTLIELLVVIAVLGILVGILVPSIGLFRARAVKVVCSTNLRQVGIGVQMFKDEHQGRMPAARYMPPPFISADNDPPLHELLGPYLEGHIGKDQKVFRCPGDRGYVHALCGSSYEYMALLSGLVLEDFFPVRFFNVPISSIVVSRDFDAGTFEITSGTLDVPPFHALRNLLFADGHVGNFDNP